MLGRRTFEILPVFLIHAVEIEQNTRQYLSEELGRLSTVIENSGGAAVGDSSVTQLGTSYGYNLLDQITSVTQWGQTRTFAYDSLGLL